MPLCFQVCPLYLVKAFIHFIYVTERAGEYCTSCPISYVLYTRVLYPGLCFGIPFQETNAAFIFLYYIVFFCTYCASFHLLKFLIKADGPVKVLECTFFMVACYLHYRKINVQC